jgi:hypothetical protein
MKTGGLRRCITWIGLCLVLWSSLAPAYLPALTAEVGRLHSGDRSAVAAASWSWAEEVCHTPGGDAVGADGGGIPPQPERCCPACLMQACGGLLTLALSRLPELPALPMRHVPLPRAQERVPLSPLMRGLALSRGPPAAAPLAAPQIPAELQA